MGAICSTTAVASDNKQNNFKSKDTQRVNPSSDRQQRNTNPQVVNSHSNIHPETQNINTTSENDKTILLTTFWEQNFRPHQFTNIDSKFVFTQVLNILNKLNKTEFRDTVKNPTSKEIENLMIKMKLDTRQYFSSAGMNHLLVLIYHVCEIFQEQVRSITPLFFDQFRAPYLDEPVHIRLYFDTVKQNN